MQITIVCHDISGKGGIERVTALLSNLFAKNGNSVTIISLYHEYDKLTFYVDSDVKIIYLNQTAYPQTKFKQSLSALLTCIKLRKNLNGQEIIIGQSTRCAILCWMSGYGQNTVACEHFKYDMYGKIGTLFRDYIYRHLKIIVTLTDKDKIKFNKVGITTTTIPNMCSYIISSKSNTLISKTIISVGRLHYQKGFDLLIRALPPVFVKYPDWNLEIYGEGDEYENLNKTIINLGLQNNVKLKGYTTEISKKLSQSSFFVLSSRYEGFPMCLVEAIAHRLPIISFDCPEGPSVLLRNNGGLLIPNGNTEELTSGIIYLIEHPEERLKYADRCIDNIQPLLPNNIYKQWLNVFKSLMIE